MLCGRLCGCWANRKSLGENILQLSFFFVLGWVLLTVRFGAVWNLVRRYWKVGFAYLLGLAALTWLLFSYYARGQLSPFSFVLATAAILVLYWQRGNISPGYWLMLLAFVLYSLQLNAWHFSVVGDEMVFRGSAVEIAQDKSLDQILARLFNGTAVYGTHPYLSSVLLAPPLKIFDTLGFGWRMGSIYPSAFAVFLLYGFFGIFTKHRVAFAAAFLLAVSHYLMTFSRIGYNNTQALLAMAVLFLSAAWAVKFQSRIAFVVTGLALAFCFYVFPAAIYIRQFRGMFHKFEGQS